MKAFKLFTVIFIGIASSLLVPIFGQWYEQQTGIMPIGLYALSTAGFFTMLGVNIHNYFNK